MCIYMYNFFCVRAFKGFFHRSPLRRRTSGPVRSSPSSPARTTTGRSSLAANADHRRRTKRRSCCGRRWRKGDTRRGGWHWMMVNGEEEEDGSDGGLGIWLEHFVEVAELWMKANLKDDLGGTALVPFGKFAVEISLIQILKNYGNYLVPVKMFL